MDPPIANGLNGNLKFFMDSAMGSRGAALMEPCQDDPQNQGLILWNEHDLLTVLQQGKEKEFQVVIHAIGDRRVHLVLDAYEKSKSQVTALAYRACTTHAFKRYQAF